VDLLLSFGILEISPKAASHSVIPGLAAFHPSSPPFGAVVYDSTGAGVVGLKSGSTTDQNLLCFIKFMIAGCVSVVGI
jgi:hypothetical protein